MLNKPYDLKGEGEIFRASSEGIVEMMSKANHELAYFHAIFLGASTNRYVVLSKYATKKVRMISTAKNPLTTLSVMERGPFGFFRNPNSNGDTQAV